MRTEKAASHCIVIMVWIEEASGRRSTEEDEV